jgi:pimeloyl-ACP methyl ester carboxylesterase
VSTAEQPFRFELGHGQRVVGDQLAGGQPGYVFLHGLGSVRAGEKSASLFAHAARRGRAALRFDQRGHGESSGRLGAVPPSELVGDALRILADRGPSLLVGSSLGGLVAAHVAAARPDLVLGLCLLAPAFGLMQNLRRQLDSNGCLTTANGITFAVHPAVLRDADELGATEANVPARIQAPTLVVHGTADTVIPPRASEWLFAALGSTRKELWLVPEGDHRLNTVADRVWPRLDAVVAS